MIKFISVLFAVGVFANSMWFVLGQDCSTEAPSNRTHQCILQCIKDVYDVKYCGSCPTIIRAPALKLNQHEVLATLALHNHLYYDENNASLLAGCNDCHDEQGDGRGTNAYAKSTDLEKFFSCTQNSSANSTNMSESNASKCSTTEARQLLEAILKRFNESEKWCVDALGLGEQMKKVENLNAKNDGARNESKDTVGMPSTTTKPAAISVEDNRSKTNETETTVTETEQSTSVAAPTTTTEATTGGSITETNSETENTPTESNPGATNSTTNPPSNSKKNKKPSQQPEHHYTSSKSIIFVIAGLILAVLVVVFVVLRCVMKRRKSLHARTDSCTYVFEK